MPRPLRLESLHLPHRPLLHAQARRNSGSSGFTAPTIRLTRLLYLDNDDKYGLLDVDPAEAALRKYSTFYLVLCVVPFFGILAYFRAFDPLIRWHVRQATGRDVEGMSRRHKRVAYTMGWMSVVVVLLSLVGYVVGTHGGYN
jgi:hypothetical protein